MATNRMYLRCKQCGDTLFLGKTFDSCYYCYIYSRANENLEDKLNEFYEKHECCMEELKNNFYEPKLDETKDRRSYDNQFDICYETYEERKSVNKSMKKIQDELNREFIFRLIICLNILAIIISIIIEALLK